MKKYFPLLALGLFSGGYLLGQVYWEYGRAIASSSSSVKRLHLHYQKVFERTTFTSTAGDKYIGGELKNTIVILNFWASWCAPCLSEFPSLVAMKNEFEGDQLLVLGINTDEGEQLKKIAKIEREYHLNFPLVADSTGKHIGDFMVSGLPTSIVFYGGKTVKVTRGGQDFNSTENIQFFKRLLESGASP